MRGRLARKCSIIKRDAAPARCANTSCLLLMLPSSPSADLSMDTVVYLVYRLASYLTLNLGEDAAVLAFMFC